MNHVYHDRDDGLAHCTVCGGAEGSLTTECCGHSIGEEKLDSIYFGGLDFIGGGWHWDTPRWLREFF